MAYNDEQNNVPEEEIEKERGVIIEEINMSEDTPEELCLDLSCWHAAPVLIRLWRAGVVLMHPIHSGIKRLQLLQWQ